MTVICPSPESILSLTKKLCSIPSVSGRAEEENRVAQVLYKTLAEIQPTQENTLNTEIFDCEGDRRLYGHFCVRSKRPNGRCF